MILGEEKISCVSLKYIQSCMHVTVSHFRCYLDAIHSGANLEAGKADGRSLMVDILTVPLPGPVDG